MTDSDISRLTRTAQRKGSIFFSSSQFAIWDQYKR